MLAEESSVMAHVSERMCARPEILTPASDANPLAEVLSRAKTHVPSLAQVGRRLAQLEAGFVRAAVRVGDEPADIRMLYSDDTLKQIVFLKAELDRTDHVDCFISALV